MPAFFGTLVGAAVGVRVATATVELATAREDVAARVLVHVVVLAW